MTDESRNISLKGADKAVAASLLGIILLLVGGTLWGLYLLLPVLVELAKDTIILGVEVFVLLALGMGLLQLWMARDAVIMKFKLTARNARKRVVADDPIGAIDTAVKTFDRKLEEIDEQSVSADAALKRLKNKVRNRERTGMLDMADKESALCTAAEQAGRPTSEINQHAVASERFKKGAATIQPMIDDQEFIKTQLSKAREIAGAALEDMKNQRVVLGVQYEAYKESAAQTKAFRHFFGANPELETINFAVEEIERQTTMAQADIDQLMHQLTPRIAAAQLQHDAEVAEAIAKRTEAKRLAEAVPTTPIINTTSVKELKS